MSSAERSAVEPTTIFLHIGKTGGSTLQRILYRHYRPSERLLVLSRTAVPGRAPREDTVRWFAELPEGERARPRLIEGHVIYGIHRWVPRPCTYLTLLRDPVALTISQYRYVLRTPSHLLHERAMQLGSLDAYVRSGVSLEADNSQTRAISGDTTTSFGACTDDMLDTARGNLERRFAVVGQLERFDESLVLMNRAFGWSRLAYIPINASPARQQREPIADSTLRYLRELNRFDEDLYAWASTRLDAAMASDPDFGRSLHRLRLANTAYRPWGTITYSYPRRMFAPLVRRRARERARSGS